MLVIGRRNGQRIRLLLPDGTEIWLTVTKMRVRSKDVEGQVWFGIDAPQKVRVHREEIIPTTHAAKPPPRDGAGR